MSLAEKFVKEHATCTPERYANRVRWLAVIYVALNLISFAVMVAVAWRFQFFMTIAQRSNVETLTLVIIFVLALYYVISTFRGFIGAMRILLLNLPVYGHSDKRKSSGASITPSTGGSPKAAYFDQAIILKDKPDEAIIWQVVMTRPRLGEIELHGVEAKYYPIKDGMNNSLLEFLADNLEERLKMRDPDAGLQIVEWGEIDDDQSAMYHSTVRAFQNLERQLDKGPIWPTLEITQEDVDYIQEEVRRLVPALRNEALLPDVEYAVEYNVPVLPEPLGFLKLTRNESPRRSTRDYGLRGFRHALPDGGAGSFHHDPPTLAPIQVARRTTDDRRRTTD